ncbi:MAG: diphosphate--fructose-6-phosphate 1-phosphotransferase [Treponema sp.]|nr:diphosphate--fructose-6-phosphate 1-phosphotransferase [Treponema sp.]
MSANMLVAHGGGPTAVINSSLMGAVEEAKKHSAIQKIFGARFGAEGILNNDLIDLSKIPDTVIAKLGQTPGSALGSCRRKLSAEDYPQVLECFKKNDIRYFFYNGGNDSMDTCNQISVLAEKSGFELNVIGIPKTIDNDLAETDHSPGYGSAARYAAVSALELAMDAASLPIHVVTLEIMGRNAGWITAATSLFRKQMPCELLVYLPEHPIDRKAMLGQIETAWKKKRGVLVTVSEGIRDEKGVPYGDTGIRDGFGHLIAGGAAQALTDLIINELKLKSRSEKPGLLGRVNMACVSAVDREEAYEAGVFAVKSAAEGRTGCMVSIEADRHTLSAKHFSLSKHPGYSSKMILVPLEKVANVEQKFPDRWLKGPGLGFTDDFASYCLPLADMTEPGYAYLDCSF